MPHVGRKRMTEERKRIGYPSIDKPWLKYYSDEAINKPVPECTIYEYMWENNKDYPKDTALVYFNRKISYG
jgi:long-chain acyl-CoA synthetase